MVFCNFYNTLAKVVKKIDMNGKVEPSLSLARKIRKKLNIGQKFQIKVSYLLYFNEKEEFLCLVMANNIIVKNVRRLSQ